MANEKKPSIYDDRGTIGSSEELDEYGVWVKSEPQELSSVTFGTRGKSAASGTDDLDFTIPEIEELPDFDTLQEEASKNTGPADDFDLPELDTEEESLSPQLGDEAFDLGDIPEQGDLLTGESSERGMDSLDIVDLEEVAEDLDLPVFSESGDPLALSDSPGAEAANTTGEDAGFTEISLDDFIVTEDTQPETALEEETPELNAEEEVTVNPVSETRGSPADLSTQLLMKIADELSSIRTELSELKKEFTVLKATTPPAEEAESGFFGEEDDEKIALTGDELNNILNTADFTEEAGADATIDLSEDLNVQEAEDTAAFAEDDTAAFAAAIADEIAAEDTEANAGPGPIEELSGNEEDLDFIDINISLDEASLAAADSPDMQFAEENLPDFTIDETDELRQIQENGFEPMTPAPAPEDESYLTEDALAKDAFDIEEFPADLPVDDIAPESTFEDSISTDSISDESFPHDSIDLSEAVIDEPDLSAEIQDNPLEEPSLEDISISLDLDEDAFAAESDEIDLLPIENDTFEEPEELDLAEEEIELPLDISAEEEVFEDEVPVSPETENSEEGGDLSLIPEGFVVEADETQPLPEEHEEDVIPEDVIQGEELNIPESGEAGEVQTEESASAAPETAPSVETSAENEKIPTQLKQELKIVLSYMDQLLEALPDDKIEEFARSKYYDTYKKLFKELGLV